MMARFWNLYNLGWLLKSRSSGIEIDAASKKKFVVDALNSHLIQADLDGKEARIIEGSAAFMIEGPVDLAFDPKSRKIFTANFSVGTVSAISADGSGRVNLDISEA